MRLQDVKSKRLLFASAVIFACLGGYLISRLELRLTYQDSKKMHSSAEMCEANDKADSALFKASNANYGEGSPLGSETLSELNASANSSPAMRLSWNSAELLIRRGYIRTIRGGPEDGEVTMFSISGAKYVARQPDGVYASDVAHSIDPCRTFIQFVIVD